jgi:hypothetical protein
MIYRALIFAFAVAVAVPAMPSFATAGNCDHSWQRAKDGSRCGERAADRREGGSDGY